MNYSDSDKAIMQAAFEVGQAQRALEYAEEVYAKALAKLERLQLLASDDPPPAHMLMPQ